MAKTADIVDNCEVTNRLLLKMELAKMEQHLMGENIYVPYVKDADNQNDCLGQDSSLRSE